MQSHAPTVHATLIRSVARCSALIHVRPVVRSTNRPPLCCLGARRRTAYLEENCSRIFGGLLPIFVCDQQEHQRGEAALCNGDTAESTDAPSWFRIPRDISTPNAPRDGTSGAKGTGALRVLKTWSRRLHGGIGTTTFEIHSLAKYQASARSQISIGGSTSASAAAGCRDRAVHHDRRGPQPFADISPKFRRKPIIGCPYIVRMI
jgi:hypothetical protein